MTSDITQLKAALRTQIKADLGRITSQERIETSAQACALMNRQQVWQQAQSVLFYAPMQTELDIWPLLGSALSAGKTICLPRFVQKLDAYEAGRVKDSERDVRPGLLGIREPVELATTFPLNELDLVLVPGLAFDASGRRLGRGKGYYDQLLRKVRGIKCGVGFDAQIMSQIPVDSRDVILNCILTPSRWLIAARAE